MTITEALKSVRNIAPDAVPFHVSLACGFTPLHLQTFLTAYLQKSLPGRRVQIGTGLYGDVVGTLEKTAASAVDGIVLALEWQDLDPRLGYRATGTWSPSAVTDILSSVQRSLDRIAGAILRLPAGQKIVLSLPTLPTTPVFHTAGWQASEPELLLDRYLAEFAALVNSRAGVVNRQRLALDSPMHLRFDFKSDVILGLPYSLSHADCLASAYARLLVPPAPKKGIISDLDNTLWNGIAGEVGPENVSWDLAGHHQLHGLYQNLLGSLAAQGVLVGIASKNSPETVRSVFQRSDILLKTASVFPIEVHWNAKSGSVKKILETWNVAADSVIFIDDSPMELAEVAAVNPGIECMQFPQNDYAAGYQLLWRLRDLCGKATLSADDSIRLESIRQSAAFREGAGNSATPDDFLKDANAVLQIAFDSGYENSRVLELVNKTNQFNLNGVRYTESEWRKELARSGSMLAAINYEDKFGPLGTVAVMQGRYEGRRLVVNSWVMSCRSFSRRIEYQCMRTLFQQYRIDCMEFNFTPTPKNGPLQEFFAAILGYRPEAPFSITPEQFEAACPPLYHQVRLSKEIEAHG